MTDTDPRIRPCRSCHRPELVVDMVPARLVRWFGKRDPKARGYYCAKCVWRMESQGAMVRSEITWSEHVENMKKRLD